LLSNHEWKIIVASQQTSAIEDSMKLVSIFDEKHTTHDSEKTGNPRSNGHYFLCGRRDLSFGFDKWHWSLQHGRIGSKFGASSQGQFFIQAELMSLDELQEDHSRTRRARDLRKEILQQTDRLDGRIARIREDKIVSIGPSARQKRFKDFAPWASPPKTAARTSMLVLDILEYCPR
jgi:hypothetical protein